LGGGQNIFFFQGGNILGARKKMYCVKEKILSLYQEIISFGIRNHFYVNGFCDFAHEVSHLWCSIFRRES